MAKAKQDNPDIPEKLDAIAGWCVMGATGEEIDTNLAVSINGKSDIIDFLPSNA